MSAVFLVPLLDCKSKETEIDIPRNIFQSGTLKIICFNFQRYFNRNDCIDCPMHDIPVYLCQAYKVITCLFCNFNSNNIF